MTAKQKALINELVGYLPAEEKHIYGDIMDYFAELGYIPQKQKVSDFTLSFKHNVNGKVIGKVSVRKQKGCLRIKYFACEDVPEKFIKALYDEAVANENRYSREVPPPDRAPIPKNVIMKKCTLSCTACTGGNMRYFIRFPDGREIFRCGAYPVLIPDITESDMEQLKELVLKQHNYFLSIA